MKAIESMEFAEATEAKPWKVTKRIYKANNTSGNLWKEEQSVVSSFLLLLPSSEVSMQS